MPATKATAVKKTTAKKAVPAKSNSAAKQTIEKPLGPVYIDPKIDALVKRFEMAVKAMGVEAGKAVRSYHAGAPAPKRTGLGADFYDRTYPVLRLSQYAKLHWELMRFLAHHKVEPNKRNEKLIISRREQLLDHLDRWDVQPLWDAYETAPNQATRRKAYSEYYKATGEQRRLRLGMSTTAFTKLRREEQARHAAERAAMDAGLTADEAVAKAKAKARRADQVLV
ncbi:MAG: hypothetical protein IH627_10790 [Rubrivivax sp.]|nr:hypothetical protein [Rubrivivax sp.]